MRPTRWAGGSKVGTSIQLGKTRTPPRDNFGVIGDRQCQGDDGRIQSSETLSTICLVTDVKLSGGFVRLARSFIGPEMMHPPICALSPPLRLPSGRPCRQTCSWYGNFVARLWEKAPALMAGVPGFSGGAGFYAFLDCNPSPVFCRRGLHSIRLGLGEGDFSRS